MANPYLPNWEYIPDGEPRVFGDRVYIYGSHDKAGSDRFCDYKLKVWSADCKNLNHWTCHGDIFHTRPDEDHGSDVDWTDHELYAPDVVYKDGKYYLYAYIVDQKGCVAVSDKPEGPFTLLSKYHVGPDENEILKEGIFIDPGVLVDDDGRVYIYCGFNHSFLAELDGNTMVDVLPSSFVDRFLPEEEPTAFFEACSPRKVNGLYYMI
ncbi:MAG: family 43 glycosylhydrolase [bacterium]|nr:family 43 glycosylhydrolase [bacterium]